MTKPFEAIVPAPYEPVYQSLHFAPAVRVGDIIHVSGIIGVNPDLTIPDDFAAQVKNVFNTLEYILGEAGVGIGSVFSLTSYHVGDFAAQFPVYAAIQGRHLGEPYPAWTSVAVQGLAYPGAQIEVSALAHAV